MKLHWYNLLGAFLFSLYGFLIGAMPAGILNGMIALADIYRIFQLYTKKELFKMVEVNRSFENLSYFVDFYFDDIKKFYPDFTKEKNENIRVFFLFRNVTPAGIIFTQMMTNEFMEVLVDYATPEYRDFKLRNFFYVTHKDFFKKEGIKGFIAISYTKKYEKYLHKMDFKVIDNKDNKNIYQLDI